MLRKDFIKKSCLACMGIAASGVLLEGLSSCASFPVMKLNTVENVVQIKLEEFQVNKMMIVRPSQLDYDIFVNKISDNLYLVLVMKCSHQDWNLATNPKGFNCSLHGSMFDLKGNVANGPATEPLLRLKNFVENGFLKIHLA